MIRDEILWVQKYRPRKINDVIIPAAIKEKFLGFLERKEVPNLLLSGGPGTGKTTSAMAILDEIGANYMMVNGSLVGGIDLLRDKIAQYASTVSFTGARKYVIIDEADYLTPAAQSAFRGFVEEYSANCGFILTCNFKNKIIAPIRESRFHVIDFTFPKDEAPKLAAAFFRRVISTLEKEGVEYEKKPVAQLIQNEFPDFRKILNTLEAYSATGKIDVGVLSNVRKDAISEVFGYMKDKNFTTMRKWVGENIDQGADEIMRAIYDEADKYVDKSSMPGLIVLLGEYLYKNSLVADPEINLVAFLTEVMFNEVTFL